MWMMSIKNTGASASSSEMFPSTSNEAAEVSFRLYCSFDASDIGTCTGSPFATDAIVLTRSLYLGSLSSSESHIFAYSMPAKLVGATPPCNSVLARSVLLPAAWVAACMAPSAPA